MMFLSKSHGDAKDTAALGATLGIQRLCWCKQVHGGAVHAVDAGTPPGMEGDALITATPGLGLLVFTADCLPVLFHDPSARCAGAAHAGWRGVAGSILQNTTAALTNHYGSDPASLRAAIGPCLHPCCFVTDGDVPGAMAAIYGPDAAAYCVRDGAKWRVDLSGLAVLRLLRCGLNRANITISGECTGCLPEKYWSHRKMGLNRGSQGGVAQLIIDKGLGKTGEWETV
jgi:hypothetical protein